MWCVVGSVVWWVVCCRVALYCSEDSSVFSIDVWCVGVWCVGVWCVGVWCVGVLVNEVSCKDCKVASENILTGIKYFKI